MSKKNGASAAAEAMSPHSVEAEEAVLGSILVDASTLYDVAAILKPADFFITRNGWIYEAILALRARGEAIDYLTVTNELRARGRLDEAGGAAYITHLIAHTPSGIYADTYAHIVERAAVRRRLLDAASEIARLAHSDAHPVDVALDAAAAALANVSQARPRTGLLTARDVLPEVFDRVERAMQSEVTGVPTGFADLDRMLGGGMQAGDYIVLAARPGMGKTAFLLSVAMNVMKANMRPLIFSLEMSAAQLVARWIAAESGVTTDQQRSGRMTDAELAAFTSAWGALGDLTFFIDESSALTPEQFEAKVARAVAEHDVNCVLVDYLGLMHAPGYINNKTQEISEISRKMKHVARRFGVPVLAAAQLNRAVEARQNKRPQLSDIRDSGTVEQDADVVLFLYRDDYYNPSSDRCNQADIIIAKQRNGPVGTVTLFFRKERTSFSNLSRKEVNLAGF